MTNTMDNDLFCICFHHNISIIFLPNECSNVKLSIGIMEWKFKELIHIYMLLALVFTTVPFFYNSLQLCD